VAAVRRALPDATATVTRPPAMAAGVSAREYRPRDGAWAPLAERAPLRSLPTLPVPDAGTALLQAMGEIATSGHAAVVQLVVRPHRGRGDNPGRGLALQALGFLATVVVWIIRGVLDLVNPGPGGSHSSTRSAEQLDPVTQARQRRMVTKKAAGAHLAVTARVASYGHDRGGRAARIEHVAGALDQAAEHTTMHHQRRRRATVTATRLPGRGFIATPAELAALWHLPDTEPEHYSIGGRPGRPSPPQAPRRRLW
ncbi:MAG: hypothetical protein ACRDQF_11615, partial [Thermocrispum sp.]